MNSKIHFLLPLVAACITVCPQTIQAQDATVAGIKSCVRAGNTVEITYTGVLKSADNPLGPFEQVTGASSPYIIPLDELFTTTQKFYLAESADNGSKKPTSRLTKGQSYDQIHGGARLILRYDDQFNAFYGTIQNISQTVLRRVYVEIYLSNGAELETNPMNLAPGQSANLLLRATPRSFDTWRAYVDKEDDDWDDDRDDDEDDRD